MYKTRIATRRAVSLWFFFEASQTRHVVEGFSVAWKDHHVWRRGAFGCSSHLKDVPSFGGEAYDKYPYFELILLDACFREVSRGEKKAMPRYISSTNDEAWPAVPHLILLSSLFPLIQPYCIGNTMDSLGLMANHTPRGHGYSDGRTETPGGTW